MATRFLKPFIILRKPPSPGCITSRLLPLKNRPIRVMSTQTDGFQTKPRSPTANLMEEEHFKSFVDQHKTTMDFSQCKSIILSRSALIPQKDQHQYNLTSATICGTDMIHPRPYVFTDPEAGSVIAFYQLGRKLAGHGGIVHGGIAATLLDECMCRACFPKLPGKIAMTVKLEMNFKSPMSVEGVVLVRAETTEVQGRKAWVSASIEDVNNGTTFVEAKGLFVQPKWAASMSSIF